MKILITGISGFVGKKAWQRFASDHEIVGTGRSAVLAEGVRYIQADLALRHDCDRVVDGVDLVLHCAGKAGAWGPYPEYERANVIATSQLLKASKASGVKRFINLSSPSIYFDYKHQMNLREDHKPKTFSNAYAKTKFLAEQLVTESHTEDFQTVSLRPRGVIGEGDRNWLPRIIHMRDRDGLIQPGDGNNLADFTSIDNLIDAIGLCFTADRRTMGQTFNITNGQPERLWDVIDRALELVNMDGKRRRIPLPIAMGLARSNEVWAKLTKKTEEPQLLPIKVGVAAYSMTLDISRAKSLLKYEPRSTTEEALAQFAKWWLEQ